jgi:hypothetical protein
MRRLLEIVLVQLLLLGCAIASEEQTNAKTLVIDVYSVKASGVAQEKGCRLQLNRRPKMGSSPSESTI